MIEGLRSKEDWKKAREDEIGEAIERYVKVGLEVPDQWFIELHELIMDKPEAKAEFIRGAREAMSQHLKNG